MIILNTKDLINPFNIIQTYSEALIIHFHSTFDYNHVLFILSIKDKLLRLNWLYFL